MPVVTHHTPGTPCWFDLMTSDAAAARAFYAALFGWTMEVGGPEFGGYAMAKVGAHSAAGIGQIPPGSPFPPSWTVYFASPDAAATADAIRANGGQVIMGPMDIGEPGHMLMASDPTGAVFGVWQPKGHIGASIIHEPGAMAWCEVNTRDAVAAHTFYAAVFGLRAELLAAPMPTPYYTLHGADGNAVAGVLQMNEQWAGMPPCWTVYLSVADTDATVARVAELGGKVLVAPFVTPYGKMSVVSDPQGAVFSVIQM